MAVGKPLYLVRGDKTERDSDSPRAVNYFCRSEAEVIGAVGKCAAHDTCDVYALTQVKVEMKIEVQELQPA